MNINCSNLWSVSRQRSGENTFPAVLNSLSTAADDKGTPSTSLAIFASDGYLDSFSFWRGLVVIETRSDCKYASNSSDVCIDLIVKAYL